MSFSVAKKQKLFAQNNDYFRAYELEFSSSLIQAEFDSLSDKEKEFTSTPSNRKARSLMEAAIRQSCPECEIIKNTDRYGVVQFEVKYPDNFGFRITLDPGVLEIVLNKSTGLDFERRIDLLQRDVFDNATKIGLTPETTSASMHYSIDVETAFGSNLLLFRNFMVDIYNHKNILTTILGQPATENAPFIDDLKLKSQRESFDKILTDFDRGAFKSIQDFASAMLEKVFFRSNWSTPLLPEDKHEKFQAINLVDFLDSAKLNKRIEFRALSMVQNAKQLALIDQLLQARLQYLATLRTPISYKPPRQSAIFATFYDYVRMSGLGWRKYQALVPSRYYGQLKVFNKVNGYEPMFDCDRLAASVAK